MNSPKSNFIFFALSLVICPILLACKVWSPGDINIAISTADKKFFSYGLKQLQLEKTFLEIKDCQESASKNNFIMIAFGPEVLDVSDKIRGTNFNRQYVESKCFLKNNPLIEVVSNSTKKKIFDQKWKYIQNCVSIEVTELGSSALSYEPKQEGCFVTKIDDQTAIFNGGYCFFKPSADSFMKVDLQVSKPCLAKEGYQEKDINLQDLANNMSFYLSKENKGDLNDLNGIGINSVRISTNPIQALIKPSEDYGMLRPLFPKDYPLNDLHLGKIEFNLMFDQYIKIKSPFIVSNNCKDIEYSGLKSSNCDYSIPVVANISLTNEKNIEIANWYDGGVASAQWQGLLNGEGFVLPKELLATEKNYRLDISFSDPHIDFNYFKRRIQSKLNSSNSKRPFSNPDGSLNEIPTYSEIVDGELIPEILPIVGIGFKGFFSILAEGRQRLDNYFSTSFFPPIYQSICHISSGQCQSVGKNFVHFSASFHLNSNYTLSNLVIKRESALLGNYSKAITDQPEFQCK